MHRFQYFLDDFYSRRKLNISNIIDEQIFLRGSNRSLIKTPNVLKAAREHFACESITGVEIENEGNSGLHWEKTYFHNELMTSQIHLNCAFSNITLAFLRDTGWYQINNSNTE